MKRLLTIALPLAALLTSQFAAAAAPPNVVLIVSDDQGWGDYGFMGHPQVQTPRIDALAAESRLFTRGYVPISLCRPSLASLVTGHYPHEHRIVGNDPKLSEELQAVPAGQRAADPRFAALKQNYSRNIELFPMLPRLLVDQGYLAHQSGKWWEQDFRFGGFTHGMTHGEPEKAGRHGDVGLVIGRQTMQPIFDFMDEARKAERPFFVFYAPMMPHTPHNPPERLLEKYRAATPHLPLARYWAMCEWFDETVGTLLDGLEQRGLAGETIVMYVTDNSWTQPVDEEPKAYGAPRGKRSQYDGGLRTPIMIRWPGHVAPRRDDRQLASSLDVMPTLLAAVGAEAPSGLPGINLLDEQAVQQRETLFGEIYEHDATFPTRPAETLQYRWMVSGEWKLIVPSPRMADGRVELFHITADPREEQDVAGAPENRDRVSTMRTQLDSWWLPEDSLSQNESSTGNPFPKRGNETDAP